MIQHELDGFEDFEGQHVYSYLKYVLNSLGVVQVLFYELFDGAECTWNLDFGLLYLVSDISWVHKRFFYELRKIIPNSSLRRNLNRLQWLSIHVHV